MSLAETRLVLEKKDLIEKQTQLNYKLERSNSLLGESEKRMALFEEQVSYSEHCLKTHIAKTEEFKKEFNEQNSLICDLKSSIDVLTNQNKHITSQLDDKEHEIEELNANLIKAEAELLIYSSDFNESLSHKNHVQSEVHSPILTSDDQTSELFQARTKAHKLESELIEMNEEFNRFKIQAERTIASERITKEEAVKKLRDVVLNVPMANISTISAKSKPNYRTDRKFEQQHKLLEMELMKETNKKNELSKNYESKISELNTIITEQQHTIELLRKEKLEEEKYQSYLPHSRPISKFVSDVQDLMQMDYDQIIKQSFLLLPSKSAKSSRKIGWNRAIATLTQNYLTVYKDAEIDQSNILYQIKIELIYYVRAISQNDLIRSSPDDILKIFQVIYTEENSPTEPIISDNSGDKCTIISNHCLVNIQYHMPATCDVCGKGLWGFIKSSYAMECKNCHFKCHKEHASDSKTIPKCRDYDQRRMAKEVLLMATSQKEQKNWIDVLMGLMKSITTSHQSSRSSIAKSSKESLGKTPPSITESSTPISQTPK
uniref:Rho-associated protein kinase 2 (Trinotate prediction) n=1 Tax=Myxobolus squamalis TaxID=59785 RepID=A0A6B2G2S6_MYXSQ